MHLAEYGIAHARVRRAGRVVLVLALAVAALLYSRSSQALAATPELDATTGIVLTQDSSVQRLYHELANSPEARLVGDGFWAEQAPSDPTLRSRVSAALHDSVKQMAEHGSVDSEATQGVLRELDQAVEEAGPPDAVQTEALKRLGERVAPILESMSESELEAGPLEFLACVALQGLFLAGAFMAAVAILTRVVAAVTAFAVGASALCLATGPAAPLCIATVIAISVAIVVIGLQLAASAFLLIVQDALNCVNRLRGGESAGGAPAQGTERPPQAPLADFRQVGPSLVTTQLR